MHWKDCAKEIPDDFPVVPELFQMHEEYYTWLGNGMVDLKACADTVREKDWSGWIVLEIPLGHGTQNIDSSINTLNGIIIAGEQ